MGCGMLCCGGACRSCNGGKGVGKDKECGVDDGGYYGDGIDHGNRKKRSKGRGRSAGCFGGGSSSDEDCNANTYNKQDDLAMFQLYNNKLPPSVSPDSSLTSDKTAGVTSLNDVDLNSSTNSLFNKV